MERYADLLRKNDSFFEDSCCFRLGDNRVVLVYQKEKNRDFDDRNTVLYQEFMKVRGNNDFYFFILRRNAAFYDKIHWYMADNG